jgi:Icc-related predicted phosphoesterase
MKIIVVSDNHSDYSFETPEGDLLIHAGDFSYRGTVSEIITFANWLSEQPHKHKLFIWGNHELVEADESHYRNLIEERSGAICLHNREYEIDGLKFFGSSFTPIFGRWAFLMDDEQRKRYWENAPDDVDVLVTHGPPKNILDVVKGHEVEPGKLEPLGCRHLRDYIERVKPKLMTFGHIHDSAGQMILKHWDSLHDTICVNGALMNEKYKLTNKPIVVTIQK